MSSLPLKERRPSLLERALPIMALPTSATLHFDARTRVADERLHGSVTLDLAKAEEEKVERVTVQLRGSVKVNAHKNPLWGMYPTGVFKDDGPKSRRLSDIILRQDFTLWRHDREYSREAPMLQLPFEFLLPLNLPSSVHGGSATKGTVSYSVELIVNRRGLTNVDLREGIVFPIVSSASTEELDDAKRLKLGWDGTQVEYEHMKNVTKGAGGGHARVIAQLIFPNVHAVKNLLSLPQNIPVPITLAVITYCNRRRPRAGTPGNRHEILTDPTLFPAPPVDTAAFHVRLDRHMCIVARGERHDVREQLVPIAGFIKRVLMPTWVPPVEGGGGCWKIETHFDTEFIFRVPPSVQTRLVTTNYIINVRVPFPGRHNDLEWDTVVRINSGTTADAAAETVPAYVELPPEYFARENHVWDNEE